MAQGRLMMIAIIVIGPPPLLRPVCHHHHCHHHRPIITVTITVTITIIIIITIIMLTPSYLLPAVPSRGKQKTGICRRTTSPRWEQTIVWEDLSMEEVNNAVL